MAHEPFIPKGTIKMVFAMIFFSLIVVTVSVLMPKNADAPVLPAGATVLTELSFADRADGAIVVTRGTDTLVLAPDTNGFIRGALRGLAHQRRVHEVGPEAPFLLARTGRGALILLDPSTRSRVDLRAFGADNVASFVALLPEGKRPGATASSVPGPLAAR